MGKFVIRTYILIIAFFGMLTFCTYYGIPNRIFNPNIVYDKSPLNDGDDYFILVPGSDEPNGYAIWDENIRDWRFVMLPNTVIGTTTYVVNDDGSLTKGVASKSVPGHPSTPKDIDDDLRNHTIFRSIRMPNGVYFVLRRRSTETSDPLWTNLV